MKKPIAKLLNPEEFESNTTVAIVKKLDKKGFQILAAMFHGIFSDNNLYKKRRQ